MARPVQRLASPGGSEQVTARISATVSVEWLAGRTDLVAQQTLDACLAWRRCQRQTAGRPTPACDAGERATTRPQSAETSGRGTRQRKSVFDLPSVNYNLHIYLIY